MPGGQITKETESRLGKITRRIVANQSHATKHRTGGTDPLTGTFSINAIKLVVGQRFYIKDSNDVNVASIDENGDLRIKGSIFEFQTSI